MLRLYILLYLNLLTSVLPTECLLLTRDLRLLRLSGGLFLSRSIRITFKSIILNSYFVIDIDCLTSRFSALWRSFCRLLADFGKVIGFRNDRVALLLLKEVVVCVWLLFGAIFLL